ncbi:MAG: hypothetical protein AB8B62_13065 [Roseobacter sp.]
MLQIDGPPKLVGGDCVGDDVIFGYEVLELAGAIVLSILKRETDLSSNIPSRSATRRIGNMNVAR